MELEQDTGPNIPHENLAPARDNGDNLAHGDNLDSHVQQFSSLACQAIWDTLSGIDLKELEALVPIKGLAALANAEAGDLPNEEVSKPVIKLRYKRIFRAQLNKKKSFPSGSTAMETFPIILRPEQEIHRRRLEECLEVSPFAFDFSMMGTGKTYVSSQIYQSSQFGFNHLLCVVPSTVKTKWQYMHTNHGVDLDALVSYSELRSNRFHQPKHGLLIRHDYTRNFRGRSGVSRAVNSTSFEPSEHYLNRVNNGCLLVIDEIQNIKNTNDQLDACRALVEPILQRYQREKRGELPPDAKKSRILLLSGSPMDKKSQVIHFYRCLGIMKSDKLRVYNPFSGLKQDTGISEIKNYFQRNFPERYHHYWINYVFNPYLYYDRGPESIADLENRCYSLFQKILKPELSSSMDPVTSQHSLHLYNGHFQMDPTSQQLLHLGIEHLKRATNYSDDDGTVDFGHNGVDALRNIQRALVMIETSKIGLLTRLAKTALDKNPQQKVVIAVNYSETVNDLMETLKDYEPKQMTGSTSHRKRFEILQEFQHPSSQTRLIIGNLTVLSTGIDLDDTEGNWPRVAFVNPNYSAISLYQFGYRFHRAHTRSDSKVYFVFGQSSSEEAHSDTELPILDSLARKGMVLKETCDSQNGAGVQFPGSYSSYYER